MMRLPLLLIFTMFSFGLASLYAQNAPQKSWKKLEKEAEEFEKLGDLGRAALYYESAYAQKEDKKYLIYRAGNCYLETRDYANAVKCLVEVKDDNANSDYDKPGLKYAQALKQTGKYEESKEAFNNFMSNYNGGDKEAVREIVDTEVQGCNFALKAQEYTNANISISHLDPNVNTDKTEFAPIPFNNDVLYYSSTVSGVSKVFRTQKNKNGTWMTRQVPPIFTGKMEKPHFGNGSFTPDGKRFFFTQCDLVEGGKPKCQIYLMYEEGKDWSTPVKLPDYINAEGANTTHPYVTIVDDKEVLYFASDREGGKGGLDLWYCTRDLASTGNNFTLPKNLGHNINTPKDEISPYYHVPSQTLYFSSNGRISAGGFDVFKSLGEKMKWEVAQNLGFPINSAADDLFFVVSEAHGGGYLVSNRVFEPEKVATTNDDIFYYGEEKVQLIVKGAVYDRKDANKVPLRDVNIKLFQIVDDNEELVQDRMFSVASDYKFILEGGKKFFFEVRVDGFDMKRVDISTKDISEQQQRVMDIAMGKEEIVQPALDPMYVVVPPPYNSKDNAYKLPMDAPIDPETGDPYVEGSSVYNAFLVAEAVAEESPTREVYWNGKELTPLKSTAVATIDPRYLVVPESFDSEANSYVLPNRPPIDPETGDPYAEGTEVYKIWEEADELANNNNERRVYWGNGGDELLATEDAIEEPYVDPRYVVVPEKYNDRDYTYALPETVPIDPKTNKPYAKGTDVYDAYVKINEVAKVAQGRKLYWNDDKIIPYQGDVVEVIEDPKIKEVVPPTPPAAEGTSYKIQVAAVRKFREYKYAELQEGALKDYKLVFEPIDDGITRVLIIPKEKNEDGTIGFKTKSESINILSYVLDHTRFKTAFVGTYEGEKRVGNGFRGLDEDDTEE